MRTLQENIHIARVLVEANAIRQPAVDVANAWRSAIRMGDQYLDLLTRAAKAASASAQAQDSIAARRANSDVSGVMTKFIPLTKKFYAAHKNGIMFMEKMGEQLGLPTYRPWPKKLKPSPDLTVMSDDEIRKQLEKGVKGAISGWRGMLEKGASASRMFRESAKSAETPTDEFLAALIQDGLDFRDQVSINVYARTNGIARRVVELSNRAWEAMALESREQLDEGVMLKWDPPWRAEIGNAEVI
jgi:hypothetical protein